MDYDTDGQEIRQLARLLLQETQVGKFVSEDSFIVKNTNELKRILVLDSEKTFAKRLEWELAGEDCDAVFADDVPDAARLMDIEDFDLAVLEANPPGLDDSIGLLRKIHREHPRTEVLMMTDYGDEELWVQVLNEGAADLVSRPGLLRELESRLHAA